LRTPISSAPEKLYRKGGKKPKRNSRRENPSQRKRKTKGAKMRASGKKGDLHDSRREDKLAHCGNSKEGSVGVYRGRS